MFEPPALSGSARINTRQTQEVPVRDNDMRSQECQPVSLTKQVRRGRCLKRWYFISVEMCVQIVLNILIAIHWKSIRFFFNLYSDIVTAASNTLGRLKQANKDLLRGLHDAEQRIAWLGFG